MIQQVMLCLFRIFCQGHNFPTLTTISTSVLHPSHLMLFPQRCDELLLRHQQRAKTKQDRQYGQ